MTIDELDDAVDQLLALEVAHLAQGELAPQVIVAVGVASGAAQWTFAGDLQRQGRRIAAQNSTPRGKNPFHRATISQSAVYLSDVTAYYLHGFGSSDRSTKAAYFENRLEACGVAFRCPDFNRPDFATLTMTRMLDRLTGDILGGSPGPVTLIGSSLGGTLAILAAERLRDRVDRLVLLAPAVMFARPGHHLLPPERVEQWRRHGSMPFFHYAYGEERPLNYAFYEDTLRYDACGANVAQPTLIFQGLRDTSVDYRTVEQFASSRPNVMLSLLDDDHQLTSSLPRIWDDVRRFLGLID